MVRTDVPITQQIGLEPAPRWTQALQDAADELFLAAQSAAKRHDLSYNDVMIALVIAAAKFSPVKSQ